MISIIDTKIEELVKKVDGRFTPGETLKLTQAALHLSQVKRLFIEYEQLRMRLPGYKSPVGKSPAGPIPKSQD